jgi:YfiH family protein
MDRNILPQVAWDERDNVPRGPYGTSKEPPSFTDMTPASGRRSVVLQSPWCNNDLQPGLLRAEGWERFSGLVHGFSGRLRGWGRGESCIRPLLCDSPTGRSQGLPLQDGSFSLFTVQQVHGNEVVTLSPPLPREKPCADGMITQHQGLLLGIRTADCVPVLLVEPQQGVIAALHAGWRGTLKGIVPCAIERLVEDYGIDPSSLFAALGPAIGPCCYEVGRKIGEDIMERWGEACAVAWRPGGEKGFLDLRLVNAILLQQAGVPWVHIQYAGPCTACRVDRFASYRREGARASRQLSVIGWIPFKLRVQS